MGSTDQVQIVLVIKVLDDNFSEGVRDAPVILAPVYHVFFRVSGIGPQQITQESTIRHICRSQNLVNLLQIVKFWRQAAMNTEYLIVDNGCHGEAVEALDELLPETEGVTAFALVVKPIYSVDGPALVVSTQQEEVLGVLYFVSEQQTDYFKVLLAAIHVITKEQVI